jgi:hypothetical protein
VVVVLDSQFSSETQFNGGAINILKEGSSLTVARTIFHRCFASYRGGAISFFGRHFTLENVCFVRCETSDSAMAVESHLDPENSSVVLTQVALTQCGDEDALHDFRFASLYLILGAQSGRSINSTKNDASHGGSFGATEDCNAFDIRYVLCHNNSGRSTFEFEDLTKLNSVFSSVNVVYCRRSYSQFQDDFALFVLTGSVLVFEKSAVFFSRPNYIVTNGDLTFYEVATDLESDLAVSSGAFHSIKCQHALRRLRTIRMGKKFIRLACNEPSEAWDGPPPTPTFPALNFGRSNNKGILAFLLIAGGSGIALFLYYIFVRKPDQYERLENLVDVQIR